MNIPNTNPTGTGIAAPVAKAPITPKSGPVLAERKVQAAKKSVMTVDARLYGVKPAALSKYINDMIKVTPFSGVTYNKTMLTVAKQNALELKQARQGIDQIHVALLELNVDFFKAHEENVRYLKELRELPKKPSVTSDKLTEIVNIEKENRRDAVRRERGTQSQTPQPEDQVQLDETNALLKKILEEGKPKKELKSGGGLMGFLKHPIKFIWDMLGSIPGGRLIGGIGAAAGLGAILMHILPNTLKALYDMIAPKWMKDFVDGVQHFFSDVKTMATDLFKNPLGFIGDRLTSIGKLLYDMFDTKFIAPIVYEMKMIGANVAAFIKEPFSLAKREAKLAELTKDFVKPSETKFDIGKALHDIAVYGKYDPAAIKTVQAEKYTAPMQGIKLGKGANISSTNDAVLANLYAMGQRYNELTGKSIVIEDAARTWEEQKKAYDEAVQKHGAESTWKGKQWAVNPEKYDKSHLFHTKAFDLQRDTVKDLSKIIDPNTGKPLLESFGFEKPMGYEPWHIQATKEAKLLPRVDYDINPMDYEVGGYVPSNYNPLAAAQAAISPPTDANAIKQTTDQINTYTASNNDFLKQYYVKSLGLMQQQLIETHNLAIKPPMALHNVNVSQSGKLTD